MYGIPALIQNLVVITRFQDTDSKCSGVHEVPGQLGVILKTSREQALEQFPQGSLAGPLVPKLSTDPLASLAEAPSANRSAIFSSARQVTRPIFFGLLSGRARFPSALEGCWRPFSSAFWPRGTLMPKCRSAGTTLLVGVSLCFATYRMAGLP